MQEKEFSLGNFRSKDAPLHATHRAADDLVVALMAIFAAFLFKTAVFPILILFGLYKVFRGFKFTLSETRPNQE
jgi:hypothetical protein